MVEMDRYRAGLEARMAELGARLQAIEGALEVPVSTDWEDAATEREADEVLEGLGHSGEEELRAIRAALGRMDSGDYGLCTRCGAPIAIARLNLLPATPFCGPCAAGKDTR